MVNMKDILAFLNALLPVLSGLGGAYIGGYFTRKSQHDLLTIEIAREESKEKRKEAIETLLIYNQIIKIDGEDLLVTFVGGSQVEFEINIYQDKIRPMIYEKFHLIHKDVADVIKQIDDTIQFCNFHEEITYEEHRGLADDYNKLIRIIQNHIENYRNQNNVFIN